MEISLEAKEFIKENWSAYFTEEQKELLSKLMPKTMEEVVNIMHQVEYDFDLQKELGIGEYC